MPVQNMFYVPAENRAKFWYDSKLFFMNMYSEIQMAVSIESFMLLLMLILDKEHIFKILVEAKEGNYDLINKIGKCANKLFLVA